MEKKKITLSQLGLYNPQRLSDGVVEQLFIVRKKLFGFILEKIQREKPGGIPQHYLIIGHRGMGKTMLLKRFEVELRKTEFNASFIPLLLPEEQYNIIHLARFWMNALDALADTLEYEKHSAQTTQVDQEIMRLEKLTDPEERAREAFRFLQTFTRSLGRRPVLLIDNMSLIFDRLKKEEQHTLRAWLMQNGAPVLVGTSVIAMQETYDYGAPFYDAFQIRYLQKLNFTEVMEMIHNLAASTGDDAVLSDIGNRIARLKTLHQLTGGNPRTVVILFKLIIKGFSNDINDDLEAMLDEITPLYKARFEELPAQMQVIVDAIALFWDPATLETLRETTGYGNNQLSPQLKRLTEAGWIEPVKAYQSKGNAYQISERFFNIWFLMRRSNRRQKRELFCLAKFLESFYGREIGNVARTHLSSRAEEPDHITYSLALSEAVHAKSLKKKLRDKSIQDDIELTDTFWLHKSLFELHRNNTGLAKEHLEMAFTKIGMAVPLQTEDDWRRFGAVAIKLGYGSWLLNVLETHEYNTILVPYYEAIRALTEKDPEGYLLSKAVEIREPAKVIVDYMKRYNS
ncbi:MAG TPA: ATP-binding protein [Bacteroidales bacterium]|nr:ATP-binding protein [Bacteroidales bacterium]